MEEKTEDMVDAYIESKQERLDRNEVLVTKESELYGLEQQHKDTDNENTHEFIINVLAGVRFIEYSQNVPDDIPSIPVQELFESFDIENKEVEFKSTITVLDDGEEKTYTIIKGDDKY